MHEISTDAAVRCVYNAMSDLAAIFERFDISQSDWNDAHIALSRIVAQLEHIESKSIQCPQHDYTPHSKG